MKILVINGPNINMLGIREPEIYGKRSYSDLVAYISALCKDNNLECECFQSNCEGEIVSKIQEAYGVFDRIAINPAAYTHTSIAILDALSAVRIPAAEVHLSAVDDREDFRKVNFIRSACVESFSGEGFESYRKAILFLADYKK